MVSFWVLGALCMLFGSMIAGHLEKTLGVTEFGYALAITIAFILFLLGSLLWISVSIAGKKVIEC